MGQLGSPFKEIGSNRTGTDFQGFSTLDPLRTMQGDKAAKNLREMRYDDAIVGAMVLAIKMIMRGITWDPQMPDEIDEDDVEGIRYRDYLAGAMKDMHKMSWEDLISDSLEAVVYGWEFMEITLKQRLGEQPPDAELPASKFEDGLVGWHKIAHRDQTGLQGWIREPHGDTLAIRHLTETLREPVVIPLSKGVLFKTEHAGGNPEGYSWLRNAFRAWRFKKNLEWIEGVGHERGNAGLPVVTMPFGANTDEGSLDMQRATELVQNIRTDGFAGVVLPPGIGPEEHQRWTLELMSASSTSGAAGGLDTSIRRYASEMTTSILAHFINLGMQSRGAYALSRDQRDLWHLAMDGLKEAWAEIINAQIVEPLFRIWNRAAFPDKTRWPKIVPSQISQHDLEKVQSFIVAMIGSNQMVTDGEDRNRIREMLGWPKESREVSERAEHEQEMKDEMEETKLEHAKNPPQPGLPGFGGGPPKPASGKDKKQKNELRAAAESLIGKDIVEWDSEDWMVWVESAETEAAT